MNSDRKGRIKREKTKLKKICSTIPEYKLALLDNVIKDLAILTIDLEEIEATITEDGKKMITKNGKQEFVKAHPLLKTKADYIQKRKDIINMLLSHIPPEPTKTKKRRLEELMNE